MAKAMLIMDMPSNCKECPCLNDVDECEGVYKDVDDIERKPTWCPLREVPQKKDTREIKDIIRETEDANKCGDLVYQNVFNEGYNDCIDEILGVASDEQQTHAI